MRSPIGDCRVPRQLDTGTFASAIHLRISLHGLGFSAKIDRGIVFGEAVDE